MSLIYIKMFVSEIRCLLRCNMWLCDSWEDATFIL